MFTKIMEYLQKVTVLIDLVKTLFDKGKGFLAGLPSSTQAYLKKTWILWAVIVGAVLLYKGDLSQFAVLLFLMAPVAAVLLIAEKVLDPREGWGLFPELDLKAIIGKSLGTSLSCALMFLGLCGLLISLLVCTAMVMK